MSRLRILCLYAASVFLLPQLAHSEIRFAESSKGKVVKSEKESLNSKKSKDHFRYVFTGTLDKAEIKIIGQKPVPKIQFKPRKNVQLQSTMNLYRSRRNPYRGEITRIIQCDRTLSGKRITLKLADKEVDGLIGGVTDRKAFGACSGKTAKWMGLVAFHYDENKSSFFEIYIYLPLTKSMKSNAAKLEYQSILNQLVFDF